MDAIIDSLPPRTKKTEDASTGVSFLKLSDLIDSTELPKLEYGKDFELLLHRTSGKEGVDKDGNVESINSEGIMSLRLTAEQPDASEEIKALFEKMTDEMSRWYVGDTSVIYSRPLLRSKRNVIDDSTIVFAVPPSAIYIFNRSDRHLKWKPPTDVWERTLFPMAKTLKDFVDQEEPKRTAKQTCIKFIPEVAIAEDFIPKTKHVSHDFVSALLRDEQSAGVKDDGEAEGRDTAGASETGTTTKVPNVSERSAY